VGFGDFVGEFALVVLDFDLMVLVEESDFGVNALFVASVSGGGDSDLVAKAKLHGVKLEGCDDCVVVAFGACVGDAAQTSKDDDIARRTDLCARVHVSKHPNIAF